MAQMPRTSGSGFPRNQIRHLANHRRHKRKMRSLSGTGFPRDVAISPCLRRIVLAPPSCVAHKDSHSATEPRGLKAATVDVPLKPPHNNHPQIEQLPIERLVAMEADSVVVRVSGCSSMPGYLGESAVSTIAIVDANGVLKTPPAEAILPCTWMRIVACGRPHRRAAHCVQPGGRCVDELIGCREMFRGGAGSAPPLMTRASATAPGPVFRALDTLVRDDFLNPDLTDDIPYDDA